MLCLTCNASCWLQRFGEPKWLCGAYRTDEQYANDCKADQAAIGTNSYKGLALFWDFDPSVKNYMRDATMTERKKVHKAFIKNNIPTFFCDDDGHKTFKTTTKAKEIVYSILKRGGEPPETDFNFRKLRWVVKLYPDFDAQGMCVL